MTGTLRCITTLATVIHLAIGCCAHPSCASAGTAVCPGAHASNDACGHGPCRDEGAGHAADGSAADCQSSVPRADHDCAGCRCAAPAPTDDGAWSPPIDRVGIAAVVPVRRALRAGPGGGASNRPPVLSELQPPLSERLTV